MLVVVALLVMVVVVVSAPIVPAFVSLLGVRPLIVTSGSDVLGSSAATGAVNLPKSMAATSFDRKKLGVT